MDASLLSYTQVLRQTSQTPRHVLLGNGFSIACRQCFNYDQLYQAVHPFLSRRMLDVFQVAGTTNIELVLQHYEEVASKQKVCGVLGSLDQETVLRDAKSLRQMFLQTIAELHPAFALAVSDDEQAACASFLHEYDNIFSTNYDLLLYWVVVQALENHIRRLNDREESPVFFLHGAMHLHHDWQTFCHPVGHDLGPKEGHILQSRWTREEFARLVAEGTSLTKRMQIDEDPYLQACFRHLRSIDGCLITFGFSFGENDAHISEAIAENPNITQLFIGLYHGFERNQKMMARVERAFEERKRQAKLGQLPRLTICFYETSEVSIWGKSPARSTVGPSFASLTGY